MSTRASAPRCASCGMPLAPDAESCAVCGARVPLIARPTSGDEDGADTDDAPRTAAPPPAAEAATYLVPPPAPASPPAARSTAFDAAAAARDVRAAARPQRPAPTRAAAVVPPIGTRVLAYAIDVLVAAAAAGLGLLVAGAAGADATLVAGLLGLVVGVAQVLAEGLRGATLGAYLLGLRTVDERTGAWPGVPRAFLRQLLVALGVLACAVGNWVVAASGAWDSGPRRRGWHDKASGTAVVQAGAAQPPSGRRGRASAPSGPRGTARPWTPSSPSDGRAGAAPVTAPVPAPPLDDLLFAPPGETARIELPPPPASVATDVAPPAPDLVPDAPTGPGTGTSAGARPEADLLPPPPDARPAGRDTPRPPGPARLGPVDPAPASDEDLAEIEHTRVRDPESLRRRTGTLALHFDTGQRVRVVGRGLVGRGPRAEDGEDILHVVVLSDAARSLSRVHAEFGPQGATTAQDAAIWVSDRGSTNGTVVVDPTGAARVLPAGARAVVRAGWSLRLGDREARVEDD